MSKVRIVERLQNLVNELRHPEPMNSDMSIPDDEGGK